jgi:hypothetical protein
VGPCGATDDNTENAKHKHTLEFDQLRKLKKCQEMVAHFFRVQEAVGSNPAVPTFRINSLRAQTMRPFCFEDIFGDIFDSIFFFFLPDPRFAHECESSQSHLPL